MHWSDPFQYIRETLTPQKENNAEWRDSFILKQTYFNVNNDVQQHISWSSAVRQFQKVNSCLKMAK
jgi:hypothetical protein